MIYIFLLHKRVHYDKIKGLFLIFQRMKPLIDQHRVPLLKYDIRALAAVAQKLGELGSPVTTFENIGDPVQQGYIVPDWIVEEHAKVLKDTKNWGYSPTEGLLSAREFIVEEKRQQGVSLGIQDIFFTSGLGHGINTLYQTFVGSGVRVLHPAPTYPSHSSVESFFAGEPPLLYTCLPENGWQPDIAKMEEQIGQHPEIAFILVIAPNNPTGVCYSDETMEHIANLARKHGLGIISDETYIRLIYSGHKQTSMARIMSKGDSFPLIVMRSTSKDIPWPGGRCGWLEFYNYGNDAEFAALKETVLQALRVQVCATTFPQALIPILYGHPKYPAHLEQLIAQLEEQSTFICKVLNEMKGISCTPGQAAFYLSAVFDTDVLKPGQTLPIENRQARAYIESLVQDPAMPLDKRFCLYLMASKGIFLTPLSSFEGPWGFRVTTLRSDLTETVSVYERLSQAAQEYLGSY